MIHVYLTCGRSTAQTHASSLNHIERVLKVDTPHPCPIENVCMFR